MTATLSFDNVQLQGRIRNAFAGGYRFERGKLTINGVAMTRKACGHTTLSFSKRALSALARRLWVHQGNADMLVLSDGRRRLTLRRLLS